MKKKLRWLLGVVLTIALIWSGYRMIALLTEYTQTEAARQQAIAHTIAIPKEECPAAADKTPEQIEAESNKTALPTEMPPIVVDFEALHEINPEIVGWLYCADTLINYPVAHTDNNTYYLNHLYNGEKNRSGTLFVDCACSPDFSDRSTVIYGHNMKSGTMFASIVKYRSQEYYEAHPVMYLLTPTGNYRLYIFSGYVADAGSQRFFSLKEDDGFAAYLEEIKQRSDFAADIEVTPQDNIITLSTCTYEYDDARYLLFAVMERMGA